MRPFANRIRGLGGDRTPFITAAINEPVGRILDVGCSYGWALDALTGKADELVGVDIDKDALEQARASYPHITFVHQDASTLPFGDREFDAVILSEVIEHVGDENKQFVIDEIHRVLKPGGLFIFTAPYAGLLAWADPMDFKRRFPSVYRLYMRISLYRPSTSVEIGHKHVSTKEIERLLGGRFVFEQVQFCGFFMPFLSWILAIDQRLSMLPKSWHDAINRLRAWESGVTVNRYLAYNVRLCARKPLTPKQTAAVCLPT